VRQRLESYAAQTKPVIEYYRNRKKLKMIEIDGDKSPDNVTRDLIGALKGLCARV